MAVRRIPRDFEAQILLEWDRGGSRRPLLGDLQVRRLMLRPIDRKDLQCGGGIHPSTSSPRSRSELYDSVVASSVLQKDPLPSGWMTDPSHCCPRDQRESVRLEVRRHPGHPQAPRERHQAQSRGARYRREPPRESERGPPAEHHELRGDGPLTDPAWLVAILSKCRESTVRRSMHR